MDASGNFVVTWADYQDYGSSYRDVHMQRFDSPATPQGLELQVNTHQTSSQFNPSVAMDINGNFVIAWLDDARDGDNYGVFAQRFDALGAKRGSEFQVNTTTSSNQMSPSVAINTAGDLIIAW